MSYKVFVYISSRLYKCLKTASNGILYNIKKQYKTGYIKL